MKIVNLYAENYKRLVAVDITPDGNIVTLSGGNAQGKTSILDSIWAALAGGDASRATQQPIRDGQDTAVVTLDLGDYIVTRRWTKDDAGTLTVETPPNANGRKQKFSSPQGLLDGLVGKRAFDPLAFTRMTPAEQVKQLVSTVDLPFDPAVLDRERQGVFDQRTDTNRIVKQLEGQLAGLQAPRADLPTDEVSAASIIDELGKAQDHNRSIQLSEQLAENLQRSQDALLERIAELTREVQRLGEQHEHDELRRQDAIKDAQVAPIDETEIRGRLAEVEQTNASIRAGAEHSRVAKQLAAKREEAAQFTLALQDFDKRKQEALAAVTFPVEGLTFDETGVLYNGIPFSQASAAEQLRVSVALAMAADPQLRIMQVRDGSLLDSKSMQVLGELAETNDFQVWLEVVDESGQIGIVIEDGTVQAVNA